MIDHGFPCSVVWLDFPWQHDEICHFVFFAFNQNPSLILVSNLPDFLLRGASASEPV
jgi:hypothetical protein